MAELKWAEMVWYYKEDESVILPKYLGEAGNSSYSIANQISAVRIGDEVLISCPCKTDEKDSVIPASTIVKGFGPGIDGKTLNELMCDGIVYNYALRDVDICHPVRGAF